MTTTTKKKDEAAKTADAERENAPTEYDDTGEPAAPEPPARRWVTIELTLVAYVEDDGLTADAVAQSASEEIILPMALYPNGKGIPLVGAVVGKVSEGKRPVEITGGYGREEPVDDDEG